MEITLKDTEGGFYREGLKITVRERKKNHISILLSKLFNLTYYSTPVFFFPFLVVVNE